ncbi:hypothetical protein EON62_04160 [archaeon]|nr:MAG: hypothetical protein EON62_04160 [archaeon]
MLRAAALHVCVRVRARAQLLAAVYFRSNATPHHVCMCSACARVQNAAKYSTNTETLADICESHVPETVETLATQEPKLTDPELLEDLATLREAIRSNKRRLTSMERYEKDVGAKRFEWSTVHSSDFWKENALNFEQDGFRIIAALRDMLREPAALDETTIAVALFDLGEFAVNHPQGRAYVHGRALHHARPHSRTCTHARATLCRHRSLQHPAIVGRQTVGVGHAEARGGRDPAASAVGHVQDAGDALGVCECRFQHAQVTLCLCDRVCSWLLRVCVLARPP